MKKTLFFNKTHYLVSATQLSQLSAEHGAEVAFIGRSNAGKSSAINTITGVNGLARTSSTPGRTQMINFFEIDPDHRLVDLPGYGFAKTTLANRARWDQMICEYFEKRETLVGLILVMDSRHPLKPQDQEMIEWCVNFELPVHILLSKADKLSKNEASKTLASVRKSLAHAGNVTVQLFSALKKIGVEDARGVITDWMSQSVE